MQTSMSSIGGLAAPAAAGGGGPSIQLRDRTEYLPPLNEEEPVVGRPVTGRKRHAA